MCLLTDDEHTSSDENNEQTQNKENCYNNNISISSGEIHMDDEPILGLD